MSEALRVQALQDVVRAVNGLQQTLAPAVSKIYQVTVGAFASLPAGAEGMLAGVTDSTTATWGATITGGGTNHVLAYFDGTNWTVAGK